jgi:hypothetical protein
MQNGEIRGVALIIIAATIVLTTPLSLHSAFALPSQYINVPYHSQPNWYYCGPACLEMVFDYYGVDVAHSEIADAARTDGTFPNPFGSYSYELRRAGHFSNLSLSEGELSTHVTGYTARKLGYAAFEGYLSIASVEALIDAGYPVVVLTWDAPTHDWGHFRVVVGYDPNAQTITVHDPLPKAWSGTGKDTSWGGPDNVYSYSSFSDLWSYSGNWGLVTYPWDMYLSYTAAPLQGQIFTVRAIVTYQRPAIFSADYSASSSKVTIHLPEGLSLAEGETSMKTLTAIGYSEGTLPSGSTATAQWEVRADSLGAFGMFVEAEGLITGSVSGHAKGVFTTGYIYTDRIGSQTYGLVAVGQPPVTLTIRPQSLSVPVGVSAGYTVTVTNNLNVEQAVILQGDMRAWLWQVLPGRWPHCNWTDGPYPFSTQFTLMPGETKDVKLYLHVDVFWPSGPPLTFNEPVFAYSSWDNFATMVTSAYTEFIVTGAPVSTSTGTGTAGLTSNTGTLTDLQAVDENSLPYDAQQTKPPGVTLPNGLFSFTIQGLTPGQTVTLYIQMPSPVPIGSQYWKYQSGIGWFSLPIGSDDGDDEITVTLTDGGIGDSDQTANGVIVDPGGAGSPYHDIAVTDVKASPTTVIVGNPVSVEVKVLNEGTVQDTFDVNTYYDSILIGTMSVTLSSGASTTLTFPWDTTNVSPGTYTIRAEVPQVTGETHIADNEFIDGTVTITPVPVYVDIKPGSWPNPINVGSKGIFTVAICGTKNFDANTVDPTTVKLYIAGIAQGVSPIRWSYQDVATPYIGPSGGGQALGGDGYLDLVFFFDTKTAVVKLGLAGHVGETIGLIIKGKLYPAAGGLPIQGQDYVRISKG